MNILRLDRGVYRALVNGRARLVYVAGPPGDQWAFCDGHVYRSSGEASGGSDGPRPKAGVAQSLTAPMPATVVKVLVAPGATVRHGDTLVVVEAMKMELPLRAAGDATVTAVHCCEGDLVQPDTVLIELI